MNLVGAQEYTPNNKTKITLYFIVKKTVRYLSYGLIHKLL
jgi:hypothetical protein